jgi:hypothetical protein
MIGRVSIKKGILLCVASLIALTVFSIGSTNAQEENQSDFGDFEVGLPQQGVKGDIGAFIESQGLRGFVGAVVNFVIALIVIIGLISIIIGGYFYMTAGGNADRVGQAKVWMGSALLGIALALAAWLILNTISPQFTNVPKNPTLGSPPPQNGNGFTK